MEEATIAQVHAAFRSGTLTCHELVGNYLERIATFDQQGPAFNAIAGVNPKALDQADELDRRFAENGLTGPLHCVPVIIKDNIETAGWETTAGSLALKGFIPGRDATAIAKLNAAGAIILAKANMADLALNTLDTVNLIHGRTKNAYAPDRVAAGSSGGTAVAIAANFGLVGIATDTGGSVRGPAAHASVVGMRPTFGLTSRTGVVPLDVMSDVVGPVARTVEDAAVVLDVLSGFDPKDPATEPLAGSVTRPPVEDALGGGLQGVRVGLMRQAFQGTRLKLDPQIAKLLGQALADMTSLGAEIVDPVMIQPVKEIPGSDRCRGFQYDLDEYLAGQGPLVRVHSLREIIASGKYEKSVEPYMLELEGGPHYGPGSKACEANAAYRAAMIAAIKTAMERARVDVVVYPTWSQKPQLVSNIVLEEAGQTLRFATAAGLPAISVPMGFTDEVLPAGLSFMGPAWSDARLMAIAHAYEQATRRRHPPVLAPPIPCLLPEIK